MSDAVKVTDDWNQRFKQATDFDSWGQLVEAADEYSRLSRVMKSSLQQTGKFSPKQSKVIKKITTCLEARAKSLQTMKSPPDIELADVIQLSNVLRNLLKNEHAEIPEELDQHVHDLRISSVENTPTPEPAEQPVLEDQSVTQLSSSTYNSLLPRLTAGVGETLVTLRIEKIGLKNAANHIDPYISISCKDISGVDVCTPQKTPVCTQRDDTFIYFGIDVELQIPIEKLPRNSAVFFEIMHYKPQKRMTSLKCFAFMEQDELKPGPCVIELYKKPINYRRKKITLLTQKPLYLHLNLTLHTE